MLIIVSLQTVSISMYFGVSWLDPRLLINTTAPEWKEAKTGPKDVSRDKNELMFIWDSLHKTCAVGCVF